MYPLLQDTAWIILEAAECVEKIINGLGGVTPQKVNGIIVVKETDADIADSLSCLLGLSERRIIKDGGSYYDAVCNIRKPQRCRVVIASAIVNRSNLEDIAAAMDALSIKKAVVKSSSVFSFQDMRLPKDRYRFKVVTPGG